MTTMKRYYVYIVASLSGTLYIGITSNLERRMVEHKEGLVSGFTKQYGVTRLVYFEVYSDVHNAIRREKQLKGWRREKKIALIRAKNPSWKDLAKAWWESGATGLPRCAQDFGSGLKRPLSASTSTRAPETGAVAQDDSGFQQRSQTLET